MIQESLVWEQPNNYFDHNNKYPIRNVKSTAEEEEQHYTDLDSDELINQKRTSWCLDNNNTDDDNEQQLRQELIQRATTRLRRRLLEQGLQDVMSQVVGLQTQLETLRLDAATTIDTISDIFDYDDEKSLKGSLKMNRQMDVLERRLESHKSILYQFISFEQQQQQQHRHQKEKQQVAVHAENMIKTDSVSTNSPLTALSMSRLSSLSLMSSIFGRSSSPSSSRATSISEQCSMKEQHYHEDTMSNLEDDDCISHIENIHGQRNEEEEDHPFYDLAGKRSFRAGSFCGSVYHDNQQEQQLPPVALPALNRNSAEIRWRRRQRRQRHQQHLEQQQQQQQQQQQYLSDNESIMSDDISSYSSISSLSNIITSSSRFINNNDFLHHPLSPITPPPNYYHAGNFFENQQIFYNNNNKDLTRSWLSNDCYSQEQQQWADTIMQKTSIYPQRNVLDEAMSFLDGLSENGDDGGFGEDMYLLLRNPDLCCRPLSEIQSTMHKLRQQQQQQKEVGRGSDKNMMNLINPATWCQMGIKFSTDMIYKATCNSLQWCRFLSVLAAAVIISLLKGPEDIRRYSASF